MGKTSGRTVAIGIQDFGDLIRKGYFYIDKTEFRREWWNRGDSVTLITRPRRFGKTLNMSMLEYFFSLAHRKEAWLFKDLSVWKHEEYRAIQGTYPVISLSFANIKEKNYTVTRTKICHLLSKLYAEHAYLLDSGLLYQTEKAYFERIKEDMSDADATMALYNLSDFLHRYYGKKVIILLDEYDTPMQEAYVDGYWQELAAFTRSLFNAAFKTNPWLEKAVMTGITRVSRESVFSDLNNLKVVTATSEEYEKAFGFTEKEVFAGLEECGLGSQKKQVKKWYDGFIFGKQKDIYNPWSILNFLDTGKYRTYWANTSSNSLVSKLVREGSRDIKEKFEALLSGKTIMTPIDEQIVYSQLDKNEEAVWSLLVASGYLKVIAHEEPEELDGGEEPLYELALTNYEVLCMFRSMVRGWFTVTKSDYNDFIKALLADDIDAMNEYMNRVTFTVFSFFDTGKGENRSEPERFYHGFVLGLIVELQGRYRITSNRESGFGRYDVILEPGNIREDPGMILEFKVFNERKDRNLEDTVKGALQQIEEKRYADMLMSHGIPRDQIRKYGFAFRGKEVLIG